MSEPKIDLTASVDDTALALFIFSNAASPSGVDPEAAASLTATWESEGFEPRVKMYWRRAALHALQSAWRDIARQAWAVAEESLVNMTGAENPWAGDAWDDALKKL